MSISSDLRWSGGWFASAQIALCSGSFLPLEDPHCLENLGIQKALAVIADHLLAISTGSVPSGSRDQVPGLFGQ